MNVKDTMACGLSNGLTLSQTSYIVDATQTAICLDGAVYVQAKKSLASKLKTTHLFNIVIVLMFFISSAYGF